MFFLVWPGTVRVFKEVVIIRPTIVPWRCSCATQGQIDGLLLIILNHNLLLLHPWLRRCRYVWYPLFLDVQVHRFEIWRDTELPWEELSTQNFDLEVIWEVFEVRSIGLLAVSRLACFLLIFLGRFVDVMRYVSTGTRLLMFRISFLFCAKSVPCNWKSISVVASGFEPKSWSNMCCVLTNVL